MILMKDILQEGNPTLRKRSIDVSLPLTDEDKTVLSQMMEYIINSQNPLLVEQYALRPAVGLAAPQIGVSKRLFAINTFDESGKKCYCLAVANPKIISASEEKTYLNGGEGCLSVDESRNGLVARSKRIKAKAHLFNIDTGEETDVTLKLSGYVAVVFQHEYDHLQGILFVDKVQPVLLGINPIVFSVDEEK
ncbi:MAG: peptide deformylase [Candidatus Izemoplasmatales bacterium]